MIERADGIRNIKGVDTSPKGHEPRKLTRMHGPTTAPPEIIRESKYGDGQTRHGTNADNVHTTARTQRHRDGEAYRAGNRGEPLPVAPRGR